MVLAVFVGEGIDAYYRSRLVDMVYGTAYRPYVYRVLVQDPRICAFYR